MLKICKRLIVLFVILFGVGALAGCGLKHYDSIDDFKANAGNNFYVPDSAEDLRLVIDDKGLSKTYLCSYVLSDDELNVLTEKIIQEKYSVTQDNGEKEIVLDEYYGLQVKDIDAVRENYSLDDFPHGAAFDSVIDDSVEDYKVIYYYPMYTGSYCEAVLYNEGTNRVLELHKANAK